jgi:hypothetical protein
MDMPSATEKPPIAASGLSVRVRIPDSRRERMGTTVMFAAVGSSSEMACGVMRALLLRVSSDDLVARRNFPTLALSSGRGLVVG